MMYRLTNHISSVAERLRMLPQTNSANEPGNGYVTPALKLLDCVLSLNRRYEEFVVPKINAFVLAHPNVSSLNDLHQTVNRYGGPYLFFKFGLKYDDAQRAEVFNGVLTYLISVMPRYAGSTDLEKLRNWAVSKRPQEFVSMINLPSGGTTNVYGFGLAGWQYLRMLFGADTCKPDRMVTRFVADCLGVSHISDGPALDIIEKADPFAGMTIREADRRIWGNRRQTQRKC